MRRVEKVPAIYPHMKHTHNTTRTAPVFKIGSGDDCNLFTEDVLINVSKEFFEQNQKGGKA